MSTSCPENFRKTLSASNKKPVVISSIKYKNIISTIQAEQITKEETEKEQLYKNYLKNGSDEIVSRWNTNLKRTQDQKQAEKHQNLKEKLQKEKIEFLKIREKDEQIRQDKIAKAQELIEKLKPGPRELQSAVIQSETMKARAVQRNITKEFEVSLKKRTAEEQFQLERQAMPWIEEEQKRISNNAQRQKQYKAEILKTISEKVRSKEENSKAELVEHKISQGILDEEVKAQIQKEQDMLKRKREALRKNALEAMIMVEQRKARDQIYDTVEGKLLAAYNEGKRNIDQIRRDRDAQTIEDTLKRNTINGQKLVAITPCKSVLDEERYHKDVSTLQLQFTAQEREKIQKNRQQKFARIQEYFRELNAQKYKKQQSLEEKRLAIANRLKNEEVNASFEQQQRKEKSKKTQEMVKALAEQVEERKRCDAETKELEKKCYAVSFEKDDDFFFDYANKLVSDAVKKERPLYPFVKAINQYKKENGIDTKRKLPPHLKSHLRIGVKTPISDDDVNPVFVHRYCLDELKDLNPYPPQHQ